MMADEEIRREAKLISRSAAMSGDFEGACQAIMRLCIRVRDEQREADAQKCDAIANHASQEETMNDAIGEDFLIPTVKFWEGGRKAATECAETIRNAAAG